MNLFFVVDFFGIVGNFAYISLISRKRAVRVVNVLFAKLEVRSVVSTVTRLNPTVSQIFYDYFVLKTVYDRLNALVRGVVFTLCLGDFRFLFFGVLYNEVRNIAVTDTRIIHDETTRRYVAESRFQSGYIARIFGVLFRFELFVLRPEFVLGRGLFVSQFLLVFIYEFTVDCRPYGIFEVAELHHGHNRRVVLVVTFVIILSVGYKTEFDKFFIAFAERFKSVARDLCVQSFRIVLDNVHASVNVNLLFFRFHRRNGSRRVRNMFVIVVVVLFFAVHKRVDKRIDVIHRVGYCL